MAPKCAPCVDGMCKTCALDQNECQECVLGYSKSAGQPKCTSICSTLPTSSGLDLAKLATLSASSKVDSATVCIACADKNCQSCQNDASVCEICQPTFSQASGKCVASTCSTQFTGLDPNTKNCMPCTDGFCQDCSSNYGVCAVCRPGFVKNSTKCQCAEGQGLSAENVCVNCSIANCKDCNSSFLTCASCRVGFALINGVCQDVKTIVCPDSQGWDIAANKCSACTIADCLRCSGALGVCDKCSAGFNLAANQCN